MKGWKSVRDAAKIDRLARISKLSARTIVYVYKMPLPKVNAISGGYSQEPLAKLPLYILVPYFHHQQQLVGRSHNLPPH